jgi:hypothetical protein
MEVWVRGLVGSLLTLQLASQRAAQRTYQQPRHSTSPRSEDREGGERERERELGTPCGRRGVAMMVAWQGRRRWRRRGVVVVGVINSLLRLALALISLATTLLLPHHYGLLFPSSIGPLCFSDGPQNCLLASGLTFCCAVGSDSQTAVRA